MFNSLKCVKRLEKVGVSREQAETHVQIMSELVETNLVTGEQFKDGMGGLKAEFKEDMTNLRTELKEDIANLRAEFQELRHEVRELEHRMTIKLGTIISVAMGILVAIMKLT